MSDSDIKLYRQTEDITVMGVQVKTFPNGIKEAFGILMQTFGSNRDYYGVSWMNERDNVVYYAMAGELFPGEAKQYNYEQLTIPKGDYKTEAVHNWLSKTDCIKDVFHRLTANNKPNENHPCIEWYKSDEEMQCMVRVF